MKLRGYQKGFDALNWMSTGDAKRMAELIICQAVKARMLVLYGVDTIPTAEQATQGILETIAAYVANGDVLNFDPEGGYILMGEETEITAPVMLTDARGFIIVPKSLLDQMPKENAT